VRTIVLLQYCNNDIPLPQFFNRGTVGRREPLYIKHKLIFVGIDASVIILLSELKKM